MAFIIATEVTKNIYILYIIFEMYTSIHIHTAMSFKVTFGKQCCTVVFQQYFKYKLSCKTILSTFSLWYDEKLLIINNLAVEILQTCTIRIS